MSEKEQREIIGRLDKKIPTIPEEQKQFILGFMEGVCQMSEQKSRRRRKPRK